MSGEDVSNALNQIHRIVSLCNFMEHRGIKETVNKYVPVKMPPDVGSLGFDIPMWVGLGMVGIWAALDAYAERSGLKHRMMTCATCGGKNCVVPYFDSTGKVNASFKRIIEELEDLRHLYAHNFAGQADTSYFSRPRHVLVPTTTVTLCCGAQFDGQRVSLDIPHLRYYSDRGRDLIQMFA